MKSVLYTLFLLAMISLSAQENCNNGIDDDGDGKIDLNDSDCNCNTSEITSIIPNPSFETHSSCPTSFSYPGNDQLGLATPWLQATTATSDYHNSCGYMFPGIIEIGLQNFPDGNAAVGTIFLNDWKEYVGTPLLTTMNAGTNYQLTLDIAALVCDGQGGLYGTNISDYETVNLTLYGCTSGTNIPINTTYSPDVSDPTWIEIGHVSYTPISSWQEVTIIFSPTIDVNAIMFGAPQVLPLSYGISSSYYPYFIYDDLTLNEASAFGVNISQTGTFCENNLILTANVTTTVSPTATYQWYLNGIAILGATSSAYSVPSFLTNLGQYSVKISDGATCYVSSKVTINNSIPGPAFTTIQPNCIVPSGTIQITTPASEYSFDNGLTWQISATKEFLPIGNYFIKIKTPNGCISSSTGISIVAPQLLAGANIDLVQPTTCDGTGSITVNSNLASEYSFDNGVTWGTNATATGLVPDDYLVRIKDASGCQSASQLVTIYSVLMNPPTSIVTQPTCDNGGIINITTVADFYSFDDGETWTTNPIQNNLPPGVYFIKVKNLNGCVSYADYVYLNDVYLTTVPVFSIIQPSCGNGGTITVTTVANEYSFDNGDTWSTSNTASNLDAGYYLILIRNNLICTSYPVYVELDPFYLPDPTYTVVHPTCGSGGTITITSLANEYSFDFGTTWSTNPVATNLESGTYYIMVRNSVDCTSNYLYVNLDYFNLPDPTYTTVNPVCGSNGSITITTVANEYSFDGGNTWTTNPVLTNLASDYYFVQVREGINCESNYLYVYLENFQDTYPEYSIGNPGCGIQASITITSEADFYSFDGGNSWSTNPFLTNLTSGQTYDLVMRKGSNCISLSNSVYIEHSYYPIPQPTNYQTILCDSLNDGSENVDLTLYNDELIANSDIFSFSYYTTALGAENADSSTRITNYNSCNLSNTNNKVYVRVVSNFNCHNVAELQFSFIDSPVIIMEDSYPLCEFKNVYIDAGSGFNSYLWSTGQTTPVISITEPGNYWVTVTENHGALVCDSTKNFSIFLSNPATITKVETVDWTNTENLLNIIVTGLGDYEYSLDGINYQDSNQFSGLLSGVYTVYVKDKFECGEVSEEVFLLMYPYYFTPNADGFNDTWKIEFSNFEPGLNIKIFDRYGKFIKELYYNGLGWDGTYNGRPLPSNDYWFLVTRDNGKELRGHFALKR